MPSRKRSRLGAGSPVKSLAYGTILIILIAVLLFARGGAQGAFWSIFSPFSAFANDMRSGAYALFSPFTSKEALISENNALRAEITQLQAEAADREALASGGSASSGIINAFPAAVEQTPVAIIARPPQLPYDTLIVSVGTGGGVADGDIVGIGSVALGVIIDASQQTARAVLFSSAGQTTTNTFLRNTVPVTLIGQGGGSFIARVPQGTQVAPGDTVLMANPQAVVAVVSHIQITTGNQIFKEIYFTAPISLFSLPRVEVWHETLPASISTSSPAFPSSSSKKNP